MSKYTEEEWVALNNRTMKQTSIEWLANGFVNIYPELELKDKFFNLLKESKEMHKQEIIDAKNDPKNYDAYWDNDVLISSGEVYYNETYV